MRIKMLAGLFLSVVFVLAFAVSALASPLSHEVQGQVDRLRELMDETVVESISGRTSFNVPQVNIIIPPEGDRDYFLIGVVDEPTPECIEFILAYTGIPSELAYIGKGRGELEFLITDYVQEGLPSDDIEEIEPFILPLWLNMGQRIDIVDGNRRIGLTMGHPINANGISFATAPHQAGLTNRSVVFAGSNQTIGTVRMSSFQPNRDVALVDLHNNTFISTNVAGGPISDFRASASTHDSVISIRGVSGTQSSNVFSTSITARFPGIPFDFTGRIAIYPNGNSAVGDSGAALIRRMSPTDRAVLGTRQGWYTIGNRVVGIYTPVTVY